MRYKKLDAHLGDTLSINENMSLRFEKIAEDLIPIWHEIPPAQQNRDVQEGHFVQVTEDVWFVFENSKWRIMNHSEHVEAARQTYMNKIKSADHSSPP
jgi:hypothetical protein